MCLYSWDYAMNYYKNIRMKKKNRSQRYDINRSGSRHGHRYRKYKKRHSMMMLICTDVKSMEKIRTMRLS